jgi:hypothetical protein
VRPGAAPAAAALLALAGCAGLSDDGLLASSAIVRELAPETDALVEIARFSRLRPGESLPEDWRPWGLRAGRRPTQYRLVSTPAGTALAAVADQAGTGLYRRIRVDPRRQRMLEWSWRAETLVPAAAQRVASPDDSPARIVVSFHGDAEKLDFDQRVKLRLAQAVAGEALPYAMLIYVWARDLPAGTVLPEPRIDRIRMIVVESGARRLGRWLTYRRNVLEDYRRAFGEEPSDIVAVGVLTDADSTQPMVRSYYGDISLRAP